MTGMIEMVMVTSHECNHDFALPKGLGTSSPNEAKEYFAALDTHQLEFEWKDDDQDSNLIDMAFNKKRGKSRQVSQTSCSCRADDDPSEILYKSQLSFFLHAPARYGGCCPFCCPCCPSCCPSFMSSRNRYGGEVSEDSRVDWLMPNS